MSVQHAFSESGSSPPTAPVHSLGFTPFPPMMAVTDLAEKLVLGFKRKRGQFFFVAVDGSLIEADKCALFHLGTEGGAA